MSETSARSQSVVRFGVFELDLRLGELRKSGVRLTLQQQPLLLLSVLLEKPGELVTREELRKRLWPEDTFVDFEHGLNATVKTAARHAGRLRRVAAFCRDGPATGLSFHRPYEPAQCAGRAHGANARDARARDGYGRPSRSAAALVLGVWGLVRISVRQASATAVSVRGAQDR